MPKPLLKMLQKEKIAALLRFQASPRNSILATYDIASNATIEVNLE